MALSTPKMYVVVGLMNLKTVILHTVLISACLGAPALASQFQGKVTRVLDGDTVEVLLDKESVRIRLSGIDCPEKAQPFGQKAKELTSSLCFGKVVTVQEFGTDRYGRTIGELSTDGLDVNHEIVRNGLAWWYRKYAPRDTVLEKLEQQAKQEKRGLWADEHPIPPWEFRHKKRNPSREKVSY